jgi:formylglycine-generating enzyme required for sulfatase activity
MFAARSWPLLFIVVFSCSNGSRDNPAGSGKLSASLASGMRRIPGGTFQMGAEYSDEMPIHTVGVSAFSMDTVEVTQGSFRQLMGFDPSAFGDDSLCPVERVTWFDAVLYCNARSRVDGFDTVYSYTSREVDSNNNCSNLGGLVIDYSSTGYRMPTEAEREYACRAGSTADYYWGGCSPPLTAADTAAMDANVVWYCNSPAGTGPVGGKLPNAWGLYDMSGNVWQWCNDWYGSYAGESQQDPTGPSGGSYRVLRGGSWSDCSDVLRSADRCANAPDYRSSLIGFRCVKR